MTPDDFLALGLEIAGFDRHRYTPRKTNQNNFKSQYGITEVTCYEIWSDLRTKQQLKKTAKPMHLLLAFRFCFKNSTRDDLAQFFKIRSKTTITSRVHEYVGLISSLLSEKMVSWEEVDDGMVFFMSVDGTHCPIEEPRPWSAIWSSHKFGGHAAVNYEVGLAISRPKLVWLYGPTPPGAKNDLQVAEEQLIPALRQFNGTKRIIADGIYGADDYKDVISVKNAYDAKEIADFKNRVGARMEAFNHLLKLWTVLSQKFRLDLDYHRMYTEAVATIVCYQLDNGSYSLFDSYPIY